jgi:hypothetical protein
MRTTFRIALLTGMFGALASASSSAQDARGPVGVRVTVRAYDQVALAAGDGPSLFAVASGILEAAGVLLHWQVCDPMPQAGACLEPLDTSDLAVRFIRESPPIRHNGWASLGYSLLDRRSGSGQLATIYVDRVVALAAASGTRADVLLGRAAAHEIGHLLLGSPTHARSGLMRAAWSKEALQRNDSRDWQFTRSDVQSMHRAVQIRNSRRMLTRMAPNK